MEKVLKHSVYGKITYRESFWTGKKELNFGETPLIKQSKNTYLWKNDGKYELVTIKGNILSGVKLFVRNEEIVVEPAIKWYEILLTVLMAAVIIAWGNSVVLCSIIPVIGGAIGGGICGACAVLNIYLMKKGKTVGRKFLIWLAMFIATFGLCAFFGFIAVVVLISLT